MNREYLKDLLRQCVVAKEAYIKASSNKKRHEAKIKLAAAFNTSLKNEQQRESVVLAEKYKPDSEWSRLDQELTRANVELYRLEREYQLEFTSYYHRLTITPSDSRAEVDID